jgi:LuxR family maltose regulon positive regulatory protein
MRARLWVRQGLLEPALTWAAERGLSVFDELDYLREFEHVTLARILVAQADDSVVPFLERLLAAAEAGGRLGTVLEVLVLHALASQQSGDLDTATASLARALELGEAEGYVRTFTDEGPAMASLLSDAARRGSSTSYAARLLASPGSLPAARPSGSGALVDPLSDRELDVLRLLASELNGPEIARHLVVSLNTVRTHTKNIYAKLGVGSRRAAVRRAEELGLLRR